MNTWKMYTTLCAACSDAIDEIDKGNFGAARNLLKNALLEAEELYIASEITYLYEEKRGAHLIQENERLKTDSCAAVPEDVRKRCLKTIENSFS